MKTELWPIDHWQYVLLAFSHSKISDVFVHSYTQRYDTQFMSYISGTGLCIYANILQFWSAQPAGTLLYEL